MKHSFDVLSYKLNLDIYHCYTSPYPKDFTAKEVITIRADSALNAIRLNAVNSSLQIDSVRQAGVSFTHSNDTLNIQLNRTYQAGEQASIRISYKHKNVSDNAFYASGGCVFTDCPPEGARKWFPCWDRPSDKAMSDITVKVPLNVRLGSTGMLSDSTVTADTIYYHWVNTDQVATYLITLTSKAGFSIRKRFWHHLDNPDDSIPMCFYYLSGENIANADSVVPSITGFYSAKFGEYPFVKIGFATLNNTFPWGGMENQTMVNLLPGGYGDNSLLAHEHSHQWFGDMITCGTWADIWLNEGFATYCDKLYTEKVYGYIAYKTAMIGLANYYLYHNPGIPIYNPLWAIHTPSSDLLYSTPLIYDKGASVLHQLRYVLGDSIFFSAMKAYALDTLLRFGDAVTEDFIAKVNEVSAQDLQWFFDEWVYAPNHPVYENTYNINDNGNGTWRMNLELRQNQTNTVFFRMPVQLKVVFTDATDTLFSVMNDINPEEYSFVFTKQPATLTFDPDRNILLKQATTIVGLNRQDNKEGYCLFQNEPNPFRGTTSIRFSIPEASQVSLEILDSTGKTIRTILNKHQPAGQYRLEFSDEDLAPGLYCIQMKAALFSETKKIIVLK
jgi:aminopeptidase N